ncbi:MAG: response regulator transcription factor [Bacteroidetes bacterium]|nr:response regulator transcription factor [Bacteroidota bacterium]
MTGSAITIVIADDHPAFRSGLRSFVDSVPSISVLAEAEDGEAAVLAARRHNPDVLVLDIDMPGLSGIQVMERLADECPDVRVLVLSGYDNEDYIFGVLERGAAGYLTKQESLTSIVEAIVGIARGETGWLSRKIINMVMAGPHQRSDSEVVLATLSEREREVLEHIARGAANADIAEALFISLSTVKKHAASVYDKLGVKTRAQAVVWMWTNGLVTEVE